MEETTEKKENTSSLADRLKKATQTKTPNANTSSNLNLEKKNKETTTAQEDNQASSTDHGTFDNWNSDEDFDNVPETTEDGDQKEGQKPPPSLREMKAGARSATAAVNMAQRMIFANLSKTKALKPFSREQLDEINTIDFLPKALLSEQQSILLGRFHKSMKKHEQISKEIPFNKDEIQDWETVFMMYQEDTGKPIPRWIHGALTLVTSLGKRGFDIYFD